MRLSEILSPKCIKVPMAATEKSAAIDELLQLLVGHPAVTDVPAVRKAILEREQVRTTGIGDGLALPHGKSAGVSDLVMAMGKPARPIDFDSVDRKGVSVIVLLASPLDRTGPHIRALASISRMLTMESFRLAIDSAKNPQQILDIISKHEQMLG